MEGLTKRDSETLQAIAGFIETNGYSPSFDEIGDAIGVSSRATVHKRVVRLESKGYVARRFYQSRSLELIRIPRRLKAKIKCPNCNHEF